MKTFQQNGTAHVQALVDEGVKNGSRAATVTGAWEITSPIRIPSHFTLTLKDCHLRMADGTFDNMLVNEHFGTAEGTTLAGRDRDITILGEGEAILDGGTYNGLSERNAGKDGMPVIWKNNLLLFTNVEHIKIEGISCHNQRWRALCFISCAYGHLSNIRFCSNDLLQEPDGSFTHGLLRARYNDVLVKNADGIDLRRGCHHFLIEKISGFVEDDTIALTCFPETFFVLEGDAPEISYVTIRNINPSSYCTGVRLLAGNGASVHHVAIENIRDESRSNPHLDHGLYTVRLGDTHLYGSKDTTAEEFHHISVKNVYGEGEAALYLAGPMSHVTIEGITSAEGTPAIMDLRETKDETVFCK